MKKNFIITYNKDVSNKLKSLGFNKIQSNNVDVYIFVNDKTIAFTKDIDISKINYSDKLFY